MRWPTWKDIPGAILMIALIAGLLYWHLKNPNWQQRPAGFGLEWQCTQSGRAGADFCYKKPAAESGGSAHAPSN
jgi:hypothetical protein